MNMVGIVKQEILYNRPFNIDYKFSYHGLDILLLYGGKKEKSDILVIPGKKPATDVDIADLIEISDIIGAERIIAAAGSDDSYEPEVFHQYVFDYHGDIMSVRIDTEDSRLANPARLVKRYIYAPEGGTGPDIVVYHAGDDEDGFAFIENLSVESAIRDPKGFEKLFEVMMMNCRQFGLSSAKTIAEKSYPGYRDMLENYGFERTGKAYMVYKPEKPVIK